VEGTLKLSFEKENRLLERLLEAPAPLHYKKGVIGGNISWRITESVDSAQDYITRQKVDWNELQFRVPVMLCCPGVEFEVQWGLENISVEVSDWQIPVFGTNRQVFESIYAAYKPFPDLDLVFEGLQEQSSGQYLLLLTT
jgi:hypothetical protein